MKFVFKRLVFIIFIFLIGCSDSNKYEWMQKYHSQVVYRIEYKEVWYKWEEGEYVQSFIEIDIKGYNSQDQLISFNDTHFYQYDDSGRTLKEEFCMRSCERPAIRLYNYGKYGLIESEMVYHPAWSDTTTAVSYQYDSIQLVKEIQVGSSITYSYDSSGYLLCKTTREFNTNVDEWIVYIDSIWYNAERQLTKKDHYQQGEDFQKITRYLYEGGKLIEEKDSTLTTDQSIYFGLDTATVWHAYYGKREYKYDESGKLIEEIIYQPDYKTPYMKVEHFEEKIAIDQ